MIKKFIIYIIIGIGNVMVFADPMDDWKASFEVQRAIEELKALKVQMDELGATEIAKSAVNNQLQDPIGKIFWDRILSKETAETGFEKLTQLHEYFFEVLELERGDVYDQTCRYLESMKEFSGKSWTDSRKMLEIELNVVLDSIYCGIITLEGMWMHNVNIWLAIKELKELKEQICEFGVTDDTKSEVKHLLIGPIEECFREDVLEPIVFDETKSPEERCEICFKKLKHFYWYFFNKLEIESSALYDGICTHLEELKKSFDGELETTLRMGLRDVLDTLSLEITSLKPKGASTSED